MAGGHFVATNGGETRQYNGVITPYVAMATLVAASGGLIFGYDIGITGGVSSMPDFLAKFFPKVNRAVQRHEQFNLGNNYCSYNNQGLQAFTSSLYLAGMFSALLASYSTRLWGRTRSMLLAGGGFLVGAILNAAAENLAMLIVGRIMLGVGVGFGNQVVPLYLSEIAPYNWRGSMNMMFQLATTIGILSANCINYGTAKLTPWGWRLSLGLAIIPASILTLGGLFLPESPTSLIERGRLEEGRATLERIRGVSDVDAEFENVVDASKVANAVQHPFRNLFFQRRNFPQLVMATVIPFFQIATGINSVLFYAPEIFQTVGFGSSTSLYSAIIVGATLSSSTFVGIYLVDRVGRMKLFYEGGTQMFIALFTVAIIMEEKLGLHNTLAKSWGIALIVFICTFVAGFGWSWGSLGWTVPSEIFPLETRSAAQSIVVAVNFFFTFCIGQSLLTILCNFKYGTFYFFGSWVFIMTVFAALFIPETRHVHLEDMPKLWRSHWFWKRFVSEQPSEYELGKAHDINSDSKKVSSV